MLQLDSDSLRSFSDSANVSVLKTDMSWLETYLPYAQDRRVVENDTDSVYTSFKVKLESKLGAAIVAYSGSSDILGEIAIRRIGDAHENSFELLASSFDSGPSGKLLEFISLHILLCKFCLAFDYDCIYISSLGIGNINIRENAKTIMPEFVQKGTGFAFRFDCPVKYSAVNGSMSASPEPRLSLESALYDAFLDGQESEFETRIIRGRLALVALAEGAFERAEEKEISVQVENNSHADVIKIRSLIALSIELDMNLCDFHNLSHDRQNPVKFHSKHKHVRALFGYQGSKERIILDLLEVFPKDIDTFYDIFAGALTVSLNVRKAKKVVANDTNSLLFNLHQYIQKNGYVELKKSIERLTDKYHLNDKERRYEGFYEMRDYYNKNRKRLNSLKHEAYIYLLFATSFYNMIKLKEDGTVLPTAGSSGFESHRKNKLIALGNRLRDNNPPIKLSNYDFTKFLSKKYKKSDFIYLDPPYLVTKADYNKTWSEHEELKLLKFLDRLNNEGIRFALSNSLRTLGKTNNLLLEWALDNYGKIKVFSPSIRYDNTVPLPKNASKREQNSLRKADVECLIVNYEVKPKNLERLYKRDLLEIISNKVLKLKYKSRLDN